MIDPIERPKPKIAILASGSGSTTEALIHATQDAQDSIYAEVGLVICNNPGAGIFGRIERLNEQYGLDIATQLINSQTHPGGAQERGQTLEESEAICQLVDEGGFGHVALLGYMKKVNGALVDTYGWRSDIDMYEARMSNTHPGILPATADTYGLAASRRILELELPRVKKDEHRFTAHTLHLVSAGIDQGPIIAEHEVRIRPDDTPETLFERVQAVEKEMLPVALDNFLSNQYLRSQAA